MCIAKRWSMKVKVKDVLLQYLTERPNRNSTLVKSWKSCTLQLQHIHILFCLLIWYIHYPALYFYFSFCISTKEKATRSDHHPSTRMRQTRPGPAWLMLYQILIIEQIPQIIHSLTRIVWRPQVRAAFFIPPFHSHSSSPNYSDIISGSSKKGRLYLKRTRLSKRPKA